MRALIVALAIAGMAAPVSAVAQSTAITGGPGVPQSITPTVPADARNKAEAAIKHDVGDQALTFREVNAVLVVSLHRGMFEAPIEGPLALVCGQYQKAGQTDWPWFFVAMKHGKVQWTSDQKAADPNEAHDSCVASGLTK
jgi:hypothetical protein